MSPIMRKPADAAAKAKGPAGEDVLEKIHAVMHLFRARQYRERRDEPDAVTHMESKVLGFFARQPGATQSDLAAHSGRDKGQLARLIGGLRERQLLEARADEADRRSVRLYLSAAGQAVDQARKRQARRVAGLAVKGFSETEHRQLSELLDRLRANLEEAGGD
jgi:DNA-binding MarR family transcriptional regulator